MAAVTTDEFDPPGPYSVAFSPGGRLLAAADGATLSVFSVGSGGVLTQVVDSPFRIAGISAAFSPTSHLLAILGDPEVSMYAVRRGAALSVDNRFTISHVTTHVNGDVSFSVKVPFAGGIDAMVTAWDDKSAQIAMLRPAREPVCVRPRPHYTCRDRDSSPHAAS